MPGAPDHSHQDAATTTASTRIAAPVPNSARRDSDARAIIPANASRPGPTISNARNGRAMFFSRWPPRSMNAIGSLVPIWSRTAAET